MRIRTILSAVALSAGIASFSLGQVTGTVKLEGDAPEMSEINMAAVRDCAARHADPVYDEAILVGENGELENVVISIKAEEGMDLPGDAPADPATLDQVGCMYTPRVVPLMVGQQLLVKNSDPFLHNVNAQPPNNPGFNIAQPNLNPGQQVPSPRVPETFRVRCDVHPWMTAYIRALEHPYFARSDEEGKFSIDLGDLPDGEYTFVAWHERYGEKEQTAEVADGKAELSFTFDAAQAQADPNVREVVMAMVVAGAADDASSCCASAAAEAKSCDASQAAAKECEKKECEKKDCEKKEGEEKSGGCATTSGCGTAGDSAPASGCGTAGDPAPASGCGG